MPHPSSPSLFGLPRAKRTRESESKAAIVSNFGQLSTCERWWRPNKIVIVYSGHHDLFGVSKTYAVMPAFECCEPVRHIASVCSQPVLFWKPHPDMMWTCIAREGIVNAP